MKTVLYFGSFNPVHRGHTAIAAYVAAMEEVDRLLIVPSPHSPFKDTSVLADPQVRLKQVREAFRGISPKIGICDVEYRLSEPLYTVRTLQELQAEEPQTEFILLMGGDNILSIRRWHRADEILQNFEIWVYPRPGYDAAPVCRELSLTPGVRGVRYLSQAPLHDISSTMIRNSHGL